MEKGKSRFWSSLQSFDLTGSRVPFSVKYGLYQTGTDIIHILQNMVRTWVALASGLPHGEMGEGHLNRTFAVGG